MKKVKRNLYGVFYNNHGKVFGPHFGRFYTKKEEAEAQALYVARDVQHKTFVRKLVKAEWAKA